MAKIYVDGQVYEATPKQNLLHACLSNRLDLPYFCWHPALGSVGACRQCAVKMYKDENDQKGRIVMACMTPATEGARISINDPEAVAFRSNVIEGLMTSHPHDCPVCDEGGECHLQDMTVMSGHRSRHYEFAKRTFVNQNLGPFINHEMNRCIQCYRCVRYYRDYAGGTDLNAFRLRNNVYFGRESDGPLESEFSGNLVEICPTGVFTDKTLKQHYTRKWDLQMAPSVCVNCGVGCNTDAGERYGSLRRIVNRYNGEVNGYFLCDRGRFGYEFVNDPQRIRQATLGGQQVSTEEASRQLGELAKAGDIIGIGSPRASLEANFALRQLVGAGNFYSGMSDTESRLTALMLEIMKAGPGRSPSLHEVESCDAVLVLGEDVTNTAPRLALSLRQSARQAALAASDKLNIPRWLDQPVRELAQGQTGPFYIAAVSATPLDDVATEVFRAVPDEIARFGYAIANAVDQSAPAPLEFPEELRALATRIASALTGAQHPLIVSGSGLGSAEVIEAAGAIARALAVKNHPAALSFVAPECNSFGQAMLSRSGLGEAFERASSGRVSTVVVLENDLYRRASEASVERLFEQVQHVVVLDSIANRTAEHAELVLPVGTFAESDGTLVNNEGRAQRFLQVYAAPNGMQESWRWLRDAMIAAGRTDAAWPTFPDIVDAMCNEVSEVSGARNAAPLRTSRKVPREPHRYSGRTAMLANITVHEPKPPQDPDTPLSFSMEGAPIRTEPSLLPFAWAPGWNSIQSTNKFQSEVGGPLQGGDPGVRLIEQQGAGTYRGAPPSAFRPHADKWLLLPLYHIFGSEELSRCAPAIAERSPKPYIALRPDDAERMSLGQGEEVAVKLNEATVVLPVVLRADLPKDTAGLPAGIPPVEGAALPCWSGLSPVRSKSSQVGQATVGGQR